MYFKNCIISLTYSSLTSYTFQRTHKKLFIVAYLMYLLFKEYLLGVEYFCKAVNFTMDIVEKFHFIDILTRLVCIINNLKVQILFYNNSIYVFQRVVLKGALKRTLEGFYIYIYHIFYPHIKQPYIT